MVVRKIIILWVLLNILVFLLTFYQDISVFTYADF